MRARVIGGLAAALFVLTACAGSSSGAASGGSVGTTAPPSAAFPVTITDDDGQQIVLAAPPERIVTFAPSMTETVFALGLGDEVVGVSGAYDDYPAAARHVEQIGGAGEFGVDPNIEKVVALQPSRQARL